MATQVPDEVVEQMEAGNTLCDFLLYSGRRRFCPELLTSLAAILGMLPLAQAISAGSDLLAMALPLSLIMTPTIYAIIALYREYVSRSRGQDSS
jgi:multidrug efflux pump subunit AcrB